MMNFDTMLPYKLKLQTFLSPLIFIVVKKTEVMK